MKRTKITVGKLVIEIETDDDEKAEEAEPVRLPVPQLIEKPEEKTPTNGGTHPHLLSNRELRILEMLTEGLSNKEIALRFVITESTVKVHMKSLLKKLRCKNRTTAALWFYQQNGAIA